MKDQQLVDLRQRHRGFLKAAVRLEADALEQTGPVIR
jgi:hypothetical protein